MTDPNTPPPIVLASQSPRRAELIARYEERSGRSMTDVAWYATLALWKAAIFLEGSYKRLLAGTSRTARSGWDRTDTFRALMAGEDSSRSRARGERIATRLELPVPIRVMEAGDDRRAFDDRPCGDLCILLERL